MLADLDRLTTETLIAIALQLLPEGEVRNGTKKLLHMIASDQSLRPGQVDERKRELCQRVIRQELTRPKAVMSQGVLDLDLEPQRLKA